VDAETRGYGVIVPSERENVRGDVSIPVRPLRSAKRGGKGRKPVFGFTHTRKRAQCVLVARVGARKRGNP